MTTLEMIAELKRLGSLPKYEDFPLLLRGNAIGQVRSTCGLLARYFEEQQEERASKILQA